MANKKKQQYYNLCKTNKEYLYLYVKDTCITEIKKLFLIHNTVSFLVGISGGVDSAFLLYILCDIQKEEQFKDRIFLHAIHICHNWGSFKQRWKLEEQKEIEVCKKLCEQLSIPLKILHTECDFEDKAYNGSLEAYGREKRLEAINHYKNEIKAHYIVFGHHLNDQIETFFIRLLRGSSLSGLRCMSKISEEYIFRPFLDIKKKYILEIAKLKEIPFEHDTGNDTDTFLRNRIRNNLVPLLNAIDIRHETTINTTINNLSNAYDCMKQIINEKYGECYNQETKQLNLEIFNTYHDYIKNEVLQKILIDSNACKNIFSEGVFYEIKRFFSNSKSKYHQVSGIVIKKEKKSCFFFKSKKDINL